MSKVVLTCKVMVCDREKSRVLVLDRLKSWKGVTFPGGHIEAGESIVAGAVREMREETGLIVSDLKPCGIMHWFDENNGERYIVFNFKTDTFVGEPHSGTDEGRVFWADIDELPTMKLARGFGNELPMFFEGKYSEGFTVSHGDVDEETQWL